MIIIISEFQQVDLIFLKWFQGQCGFETLSDECWIFFYCKFDLIFESFNQCYLLPLSKFFSFSMFFEIL